MLTRLSSKVSSVMNTLMWVMIGGTFKAIVKQELSLQRVQEIHRLECHLPCKLDCSVIPSNAGTSDPYGELSESPLIVRAKLSDVCKKSEMKLCAVVSFTSSGM